MHVKLAYAVSVAAGVAMPPDCRNKSDDGAGTAAWIKVPASHARVAETGRAARSMGRIAYSDNENGVRLANEERSMHYPASDGRPGRRWANTEGILGFVEMGTRVAYSCADDRSAAVDGHPDSGMSSPASDLDADIVQIPSFPAYFFDEARPCAGARRKAAIGASAAILTQNKRARGAVGGGAGTADVRCARAFGIGAEILGGDGVWSVKVAGPADDARPGSVRPAAGYLPSRTARRADAGRRHGVRVHTPARIDAPFTSGFAGVIVDATKCASSIDAPTARVAMRSADSRAGIGRVAVTPERASQDGAETFYDFKETLITVLDVVTM